MNEEYESIMKNDLWDVVCRPDDKSVVTSKWLYKIKHGVDVSAKKYKTRLKKALYGYERIDNYLMKLRFPRSDADPNLYLKVEKDMPLILVLYVDDLFVVGANPLIYQSKRELASEFEMKDLGLMHYFLGLEFWQKLGEIFLSQGKYIVKLLERCGMVDCKSVSTLMELNFKKLCGSDAGPELANPSEYRQLL
eukprot:PITA_02308